MYLFEKTKKIMPLNHGEKHHMLWLDGDIGKLNMTLHVYIVLLLSIASTVPI
jgi:hypothetical protein